MTVDYGKIVTNALSTLVAAVFVGAAAIVWNAATSIDERIDGANRGLVKQQAKLQATQETILPELAKIQFTMTNLQEKLGELNANLAKSKELAKILSSNSNDAASPNARALTDKELKNETQRLFTQIDVRQQEIVRFKGVPVKED